MSFISKAICFLLLISNTGLTLSFASNEERILKIIDTEVFQMAEKGEMKWTKKNGVQPIIGYEMDYAEKCLFIANSTNKKALKACKALGL